MNIVKEFRKYMTKFGFTKSIVHLLRNNSLYNKTRFMKRTYLIKIIPVLAVIIALVISGLAWQTNPGKGSQAKTDTIPDRKKKIREQDKMKDYSYLLSTTNYQLSTFPYGYSNKKTFCFS